MLSKGTAMLDMGESLRIDELVRTMKFEDDSVDKETLKQATCHIKQIVGPGLSEHAAEVFLGAVRLSPAMPSLDDLHAIQHFLCSLTGCRDDDEAG